MLRAIWLALFLGLAVAGCNNYGLDDRIKSALNSDSTANASGGTYSYDSATGMLVITWTYNNIGPCLGSVGKTETKVVNSITATTMVWDQGGQESMTWTRASGNAGVITGSWQSGDPNGSSFTMQINADGTFRISGTFANCTGSGQNGPAPVLVVFPSQAITIDGTVATDWTGVPVAMSDSSTDAGNSGRDIKAVYAAQNGTNYYFRIDLAGSADTTVTYNVNFSQPFCTGTLNFTSAYAIINFGANWQVGTYGMPGSATISAPSTITVRAATQTVTNDTFELLIDRASICTLSPAKLGNISVRVYDNLNNVVDSVNPFGEQ